MVFPNPTKGSFTVSFDGSLNENITIEIINPIGQIIYSEVISKNEGRLSKNLDLKTAASGIYFVKVQSSNDYWIERITKE